MLSIDGFVSLLDSWSLKTCEKLCKTILWVSINLKWKGINRHTLRNGELTAATLESLTAVLCHEDCRVRRRRFRQGLVESCADGLGSASGVSLFFSPFSSFLCFLLLRYCFFFPATRRSKWKWGLRPKRPTLRQKTPFAPLILLSSHAKWYTYRVQLCL